MKNKIAKIAFIILSVVFVFSACMAVFAVTTKSVTESQNGIEATLNFNKQEYNSNENIEVTLNVKNKGMYVEGDTVSITAEDAPEGTPFAGWIFADYHNKLDGTDRNIIIYGILSQKNIKTNKLSKNS